MPKRVRMMLTVRNRFDLTKYCLNQLLKSYDKDKWSLEIFLYDNLSQYDMTERAMYYSRLLETGQLTQVTFNTKKSTDNAFSKAASNNQFADFHLNSLDRSSITYLILMDNDMLCLDGWLEDFHTAWEDVKSSNLKKSIKVVTQNPGGVMGRNRVQLNGRTYYKGTSGGSGLWICRTGFFNKVGKIDLRPLVGKNKGHDSQYWRQIKTKTGIFNYALTVPCNKVLHLGGICGSVCNCLQKRGGRDIDRVEEGFKRNLKGLTPEQIAKRFPKFFRW